MSRILIMEDNIALAFEWRDAFQLNGYDVTLCHSGNDAVGFLTIETFDLVITDLFVSKGRGGLFVITKLKSMGIKAPPVIAVTGAVGLKYPKNETNHFLAQALALGASKSIEKPFVAAELIILAQSLMGI